MSEWSREKTVFVLRALGVDQKQLDSLANKTSAMVSCPFHRDKTPSFSVRVLDGVAHCFSCGWGGHLAKAYHEKFGHTVETDMGESVEHFRNPLKRARAASLSYDDPPFVDLRFDGETVPVERSKTALEYLERRKARVEPLAEMNAFYCVTGGTVAADGVKTSFRDRLCVPVYEYSRGKRLLLSIEGRACSLPRGDASFKKVLYPHGSSVNTLFESWKLRVDEPLYVVEGLMDLAALREAAGFENSTAVFGASVTSRQAYLLSRYDVYYVQDADAAGEASVEGLKKKLESFRYLGESRLAAIRARGIKDMGDVNRAGMSVEELKSKKFFDGFVRYERHAV